MDALIRKLLLCLLLVALAGCAGRRDLIERGLRDARSTADELAEAVRARRVAVLIGVTAYDDPAFPELRFPGADATALGEILGSPTGGGFDQVITLTRPEDTSRAHILQQLKWITDGLGRQDVLVVYFSGHGTVASVGGAPARLYLLGRDARAADLPGSALDLSELRSFFSRLAPQRKALIIDACFNGRGKSSIDPDLRGRVDDVLQTARGEDLSSLGSGEAHLYATTLGRSAFEDEELGHGVYTHYLLQALSWARQAADLDGDGLISAYEAHDYARGRTQDHTAGRQVPEASLRVVGRNDLILVGDPEGRAGRDSTLVYDYGTGSSPWAGASLWLDGRSKGVFPGTVVVPPGEHHVEVRGEDGERLLEGYARFRPDDSVGIRELEVLVRKERVLQSVGGAGLTGPPSSWGTLWGGGLIGLEARGSLRLDQGPARGLMVGGILGGGVAPSRGLLTGDQPRGALWAGLEGGYAGELRRLRLRAGWQLRLTGLPTTRLPGAEHATLPEEAGWMLFSMGPVARIGVALDRRWTLLIGATLQSSPLRTEPGAALRLHSFVGISGGLELAL